MQLRLGADDRAGPVVAARAPVQPHLNHVCTQATEAYCAIPASTLCCSRPRADQDRMPEPKSRDLFPGALEMMVLRLLKREPMHGYALVQRIQQASNNLLQVEEGSLYPALQRLLRDGLLDAKWGVSSTNRRVRIYRLTPAGAKHVSRAVASFERMFTGINLVLAATKA